MLLLLQWVPALPGLWCVRREGLRSVCQPTNECKVSVGAGSDMDSRTVLTVPAETAQQQQLTQQAQQLLHRASHWRDTSVSLQRAAGDLSHAGAD